MTKIQHRKKIRAACADLGTYKPQFDSVIETLADILAKRDEAAAAYEADGSGPIMDFNGGKTYGMNPYLKVYMDLNAQAIKIWSELGMTPAGLKRINDKALEPKKVKGLSAALAAAQR